MSLIHHTFVIERSYPKSPATVFDAFADPAKKRLWYAESRNHTVEEYSSDFRVDGEERFQYRFREGTPFPGVAITSAGVYEEIIPGGRIIMASRMALGGNLISVTLVTFEFLPSDTGTTLVCTHQAAFSEQSDGPERREAGWQTLFDNLSNYLEHV